jgi:hypothetical protein
MEPTRRANCLIWVVKSLSRLGTPWGDTFDIFGAGNPSTGSRHAFACIMQFSQPDSFNAYVIGD